MALRRSMMALWLAGGILAANGLGAAKWRVAYFYDQDRSSLTINDLAFPSPARGVAVGYIEEKDKAKPVALISKDGGAHWTVTQVKQTPVSVFFLNDSLGWMVTPKGIFRTTEGGLDWHELPKSPELLTHVYFLDDQHGFAVGLQKSAYETVDGGKTWQPIVAAAQPHTNPAYTVYNNITFVNSKTGLINGYSAPPRMDDGKPEWLDPAEATKRREWPHLSIMLDTRDGGKTWQPSTGSMFGRIAKTMFLPDGKGLGLIEFTENFKWPSEVHRLDATTGKSTIVYNAKDVVVTDVSLQPSQMAYIAGVEVQGRLQHTPIPSKVRVLKSTDLENWQEMDVDYRASAVRALLRSASDGSLWLATDTGMILKLAE